MTTSKSFPRPDSPTSRRLTTLMLAVLGFLIAAVTLIAVPSAEAEQSVPKANPDGTPPTDEAVSSSAFSTSGSSTGGYTVAEDRRLYVPARRGVLRNDRGSGKLRAKMARRTLHGSVRLRSSGSFTYVPRANYNGSDSFRYRACNSAGCSRPATVYIRISPVNDAPVARPNLIGTNEDTRLTTNDPGVIGNDSDIDNGLSSLRTSIVDTTTNGSLSLNPGGGLSYTPRANYSGSDSFIYRLSDGRASDTATVTISVRSTQDAPVARGDVYSARVDQTRVIAAPGVLKNDSDPDGDKLSVAGYTQPRHARVTLWPGGTLRFDPDKKFKGRTEFRYTVSDGYGNRKEAIVKLRIGV